MLIISNTTKADLSH